MNFRGSAERSYFGFSCRFNYKDIDALCRLNHIYNSVPVAGLLYQSWKSAARATAPISCSEKRSAQATPIRVVLVRIVPVYERAGRHGCQWSIPLNICTIQFPRKKNRIFRGLLPRTPASITSWIWAWFCDLFLPTYIFVSKRDQTCNFTQYRFVAGCQ